MWWAGSEAQLYLGSHEAELRLPGADLPVRLVCDVPAQLNAAAKACADATPVPRKLRLWLSGALAQVFMLPATQGLKDRSEAQALAASLAPQHVSAAGAHAVWLDHCRTGHDCLVVAVPKEVIETASSVFEAAGVRLTGIAPAWNEALKLYGQQPLPNNEAGTSSARMLLVRERDAVTLLMLNDASEIANARTVEPAPDRLSVHPSRWAMGWGVSEDQIHHAGLAFTGARDHVFNVTWRRGTS